MAEDQEKFMRMVFSYQDSLEAYANAILNDWTLSKDAVQEAFINASVKWEEIDENFLFAWLKKVTRDKARELICQGQKVSRTRDAIDKLIDQHFDVYLNEKLHEKYRVRKLVLETCIQKLRPESLKAMVSFYKEHQSCEDIAGSMNKSVDSIRTLLQRSRDSLRKCIKSKRLKHD